MPPCSRASFLVRDFSENGCEEKIPGLHLAPGDWNSEDLVANHRLRDAIASRQLSGPQLPGNVTKSVASTARSAVHCQLFLQGRPSHKLH
jgi:hypothetical protein